MALKFDEEKQKQKLGEVRRKEEEDLAELLAKKHGLPYINLTSLPINLEALRLISEDEARAGGLGAFDVSGNKVRLALLTPQSAESQAAIVKLKDRKLEPELFLVSKSSLEKVWSLYKNLSLAMESRAGTIEISTETIEKLVTKIRTIEELRREAELILKEGKTFRVSRLLELFLAGALAVSASDIHLEPEEKYVRLRLRLDGVLKDILNFDPETYNLARSRIKLISGLKLNIQNEAQDGRLSVKLGDSDIEIRTSILPGAYNEAIVLRLLNPKTIAVPLEELGIEPSLLIILEGQIKKPEGMVLTTGPTGSGKTTTLYAFLKKIHKPEVKIITIEDPVEYHLPGIVQTQTGEEGGYTFLSGLRSALRQDPDIIMVGEIRDGETALVAVNAALTGHLVFSTLHTNNAAGTFPRLIDLGVNAKIISSALSVALAQRLVRRLCSQCKKERKLAGADKTLVESIFGAIGSKQYTDLQREKIWEPAGCSACHGTGFKGRTGIFEAILVDEHIEKAVIANPSERDIKRAARRQGILDLRQDGIIKVLRGITSLDELRRVVNLEGSLQD